MYYLCFVYEFTLHFRLLQLFDTSASCSSFTIVYFQLLPVNLVPMLQNSPSCEDGGRGSLLLRLKISSLMLLSDYEMFAKVHVYRSNGPQGYRQPIYLMKFFPLN